MMSEDQIQAPAGGPKARRERDRIDDKVEPSELIFRRVFDRYEGFLTGQFNVTRVPTAWPVNYRAKLRLRGPAKAKIDIRRF